MTALGRIAAITRKEFVHLIRDPRALAMVILMPLIQLVLFAYAISFDITNVTTVVVDQDRSVASREYVARYRASDFFNVQGEAADLAAVDRLFDEGRAAVVVVIPPGFERDLARGQRAAVAVFVDGTETNAARTGEALVQALNQLYGQQLTFEWADRQGMDLSRAGRLEPRVRTWYNPDRQSSMFLIPGLMVVILMIVTVQQTAVTLVRERDQGTAAQLRISPLRQIELMVGKLLPWTILGLADALIIAVIGMFGLGLPLRGDPWVLAAAAAVFVFASLGLGLIASALAPGMETANMLAIWIAFLPGFLLSGFAFPLEIVPAPLQWLSCVFPARFMVTIARGVFLKGAGWDVLWPDFLKLVGYAVAVLLVATVLNSRRRA